MKHSSTLKKLNHGIAKCDTMIVYFSSFLLKSNFTHWTAGRTNKFFQVFKNPRDVCILSDRLPFELLDL